MAHLAQTVGQFFFFLLTYILLHIAGSSVGILIGSIVQDAKSVSAVVPLVILPLILFSGFFVNRDTMPKWIGWIEYISPIKYGFICFVTN
jgi:ABC-type multidrug transport system permease subunit